MIVAYAGRRAQSLGRDPEAAGLRIRRLLAAIDPRAVVGAAADGADLLVLEAVLQLRDGAIPHVILPTPRGTFEQDSVDPQWRDRFADALDAVEQRGGSIEALELEPGHDAYRAANKRMLARAAELAVDSQRAMTLLVARDGEGAMVTDLQHRSETQGVPVLRIDPEVDLDTRPKCFVAMPFGRKADPQRKIEVDCNLVYQKILVPALENAQLSYRRGDEEIDSGIVLEPMIEWLSDADVVIGDLETGNFNVGWELGLRHLLRPARTLLITPTGTTAPFDLAAVRNVRYRHDESGVSDDAAIEAWQALAPYLADTDAEPPNDSPVATVMDVEQWGVVRRRSATDTRWEERRHQLALARDLRDADLMLAVLDDVHGFSDEQVRLLRGETGVGLVRLGRFADAEQLLREVVTADPGMNRPDAHVYYAQALYRAKQASPARLAEAEQVLKRVLLKRPGQPEVRALLGAVAKRRAAELPDAAARSAGLRLALDCYSYDFERNLNLYYEGINVVALSVALALGDGDAAARARAAELLPAVQVAAKLALDKPDQRFWAAATLAECALHASLLELPGEPNAVADAYHAAGALRPLQGDLESTLSQLEFLRRIGLPAAALDPARSALLAGAGQPPVS
jgi:hypothetical protein